MKERNLSEIRNILLSNKFENIQKIYIFAAMSGIVKNSTIQIEDTNFLDDIKKEISTISNNIEIIHLPYKRKNKDNI